MNDGMDVFEEYASESEEIQESSDSEGEPFMPHEDYQRGITFDESEAYVPEGRDGSKAQSSRPSSAVPAPL
jgi:hypothetical protein